VQSPADFSDLGRMLVIAGAVLALIGILVMVGPRIPFLGRLPGDIFIQRDGVTIIFPIVTMILVSVVLTIVLNVVARIFR